MKELAHCTSRAMTPDERLAFFREYGIVNAEVRDALGFKRAREAATPRLIKVLWALGWPAELLEDSFDLTTQELRRLVRPIRTTAIRAQYLTGSYTREIAERLDVTVMSINAVTSDITRRPRGANARRKGQGVAEETSEAIRWHWTAGACRGELAHAFGVSRSAVTRAVGRLRRGSHEPCAFCKPGPKANDQPSAGLVSPP